MPTEEIVIFITKTTVSRLNGDGIWWKKAKFRRTKNGDFCYRTRVPRVALNRNNFNPALCEPDILAERCRKVA